MHIKYVTVQGFKSYRDAVKTDELSPAHNIVVGRNGSGKSNFFNAIQFVLSEDFSRLSPEQRQSFIYEGAGATRVMSAYVEIIFDNTDKRLMMVDREEVALRRHIGSKKDQFFLDGKIVTRNDVMNLLESAGFSRSNPYYIVKQGKINEIATAQDKQRLKLLKEVAGTKVYEDRKAEAAKMMQESETKLLNSKELLTMIDDKLKTLEHEKAELVEYQKLDKRKRALEFSIENTELREVKRKLDDLGKKRSNEISTTANIQQMRYEAEASANNLRSELDEQNRKLNQLIEEQSTCDRERTGIVQKKERLDLRVRDFRKQKEIDEGSHDSARTELEKLQDQIELETNKLETLVPEYESMFDKESELTKSLNQAKLSKTELVDRRGRKSGFASKNARDSYLQKQIESINNQLENKKEEIANCKHEVAQVEQICVEIEEKIDSVAFEKLKNQQAWESEHNELTVLKRGREEIYQKKHEIVRKENNAYSQIESYKATMQSKKHRFNQMIGKANHNALRSLETVRDYFRRKNRMDLVDGYYGQVIDFVNCPEEFFTSVEAAGGGKLFNFVMKNVKVVKAYVAEMNRQNLPGSPNCQPLDDVRKNDVEYNYPDENQLVDENGEPCAFPLAERIEVTDEYMMPLIRKIFGKYMVTVDSFWSSKIARDYNLSCVTLEGDMTSHTGVISGGYRDQTRSKLRLHHEIHRSDEVQLKGFEAEFKILKEEKRGLDDTNQKLLDDIANKEGMVQRYRQMMNKSGKEESMLKTDKQNRAKFLSSNERAIKKFHDDIGLIESQLASMNRELTSDWSQHSNPLSQAEQENLQDLQEKVNNLTNESNSCRGERMRLERQKNAMESNLYDNLHKRRDQLIQDTDDITLAERGQQLSTCEADLETATRELEYVEKRLYELGKELEGARHEENSTRGRYDEHSAKEKDCASKLDEEQKSLVKLSSKQQSYTQKQDECQRKINEIGPVAQEIVRKYKGMSVKSLYQKLHDTKTDLQKFGNVNKKALDQFMSSSEERRKLEDRKQEIVKGKDAIRDMMTVLEEKKHNQINFTFKQVSRFFKEVFAKLVPGGHANLVMKKDESGSENLSADELYIGVSIKVSFSGGGETREMNQLSGGQKSLVALTLIFAIQKCDPAPFYLFDEIDAALDPAYRKAVASMIMELSEHAQFISTTFRPELLEAGDMFLGVLYKHKVSDVRTITKQQATEFVEDDAVHG